jgi:hypothetical protein
LNGHKSFFSLGLNDGSTKEYWFQPVPTILKNFAHHSEIEKQFRRESILKKYFFLPKK